MADSPSKFTLNYLKGKGVTNIYKTNLPDADVVTCIFDTGGYNNDGDAGRPTIQIRHRNTNYDTGYSQMQDIKKYLNEHSSGYIFGYDIVGDINYLGTDETGRYDFTINAIAYREEI